MDKKFLKLKAIEYRCPFCGKWHKIKNPKKLKHYTKQYGHHLECPHTLDCLILYFKDNDLYLKVESPCELVCNSDFCINQKIPITDIIENSDEFSIEFSVPFTTEEDVDCLIEQNCCYHICLIAKLCAEGDGRHINIPFGFKFKEDDYNAVITAKGHEQQNKKDFSEKEDNTMSKETTTITRKTTSLWDQLYRHSPEENVEILKEWANKYKPTLKWAIPVISIYAAYRILNSNNSNLNINNIFEQSEKELGFGFESLKDKKTLKKLLILGGTTAGAYATIKAVSSIYNSSDNKEQLSVENIEQTMDSLDSTSKKFAWIQPQTEAMLPVAVSVIIVYLMTQKPKWFETLKEKINNLGDNISAAAEVYLGMAKSFISNTLNIASGDQEESKNFKKFVLLAGIVGILVFLYGKGILQKDDEENKSDEKVKEFISQISSIMKKLMPTAFAGLTTFLVTKHIINDPEDSEVEILEISDSEESQNNTPEDDDDESESELE